MNSVGHRNTNHRGQFDRKLKTRDYLTGKTAERLSIPWLRRRKRRKENGYSR
jgi:hypothetical protein